MNLGEGESPLATYFFRGTSDQHNTSVLTSRRLVVIYKGLEESYPLSKITAVRAQFQRSILMVLLGAVFMLTSLFAGFMLHHMKIAMQEIVNDANVSQQRPAGPAASGDAMVLLMTGAEWTLLPFSCFASCWLAFYGWRGQTSIQITYFAGEKVYAVPGQDSKLTAFAESIAQQLA